MPQPLPSTPDEYAEFQEWYGNRYHTGDSRLDMQRSWFAAKGIPHPQDDPPQEEE